MRLITFFVSISLILSTHSALGHEFWIAPERFVVPSGEPLVADLKVGQNLQGTNMAFIPRAFERFDLVRGAQLMPAPGRIGDRPALTAPGLEDGLWIIVHETTDSTLTYTDNEKFVNFATHKDLGDTLERHEARGLPATGFVESYRRFGKSLVAVGTGQGVDKIVGLRTEIVAGLNPYVDDVSEGMPFTVYLDGAPRANVQVEVFDHFGEDVDVKTTRTDDAGRVVISVQPGHDYLIDAVHMEERDEGPDGPVWYSLWASLTFAVPR